MRKGLLISISTTIIFLFLIMIFAGNYSPMKGSIYPGSSNLNETAKAEYENALSKVRTSIRDEVGIPKNGSQMGPIGISEVSFDSAIGKSKPEKIKYFISFHNFFVKQKSDLNGVHYIVENAKPYILKNGQKISIPFFLKYHIGSQAFEKNGTVIMFPINKFLYKTLNVFWYVILIFILIVFVGIFLGGLWRFTENIANGEAFSETNVIVLRNISYLAIGLPIFSLVVNLLLWLWMQKIYSGGFGLSPDVFFFNMRFMLVGGFFFVLYIAFKKGYKLQQENDLTV